MLEHKHAIKWLIGCGEPLGDEKNVHYSFPFRFTTHLNELWAMLTPRFRRYLKSSDLGMSKELGSAPVSRENQITDNDPLAI
jgi:hypothetical protein